MEGKCHIMIHEERSTEISTYIQNDHIIPYNSTYLWWAASTQLHSFLEQNMHCMRCMMHEHTMHAKHDASSPHAHTQIKS